jgi:hypothetical protein
MMSRSTLAPWKLAMSCAGAESDTSAPNAMPVIRNIRISLSGTSFVILVVAHETASIASKMRELAP